MVKLAKQLGSGLGRHESGDPPQTWRDSPNKINSTKSAGCSGQTEWSNLTVAKAISMLLKGMLTKARHSVKTGKEWSMAALIQTVQGKW